MTLVESLTRQSLAPAALGVVHAVYRETDGNPFFVEALLRHLAETGAVYIDDDGRWVPRADLDEAGLPESVREVVGRRVARLGEACQRALNVAAVIGQEFDLETVVRRAGRAGRRRARRAGDGRARRSGVDRRRRDDSRSRTSSMATTLYSGL